MYASLQKECSYGVMDAIRGSAGLDGGRHNSFVIIFRPDKEVRWKPTNNCDYVRTHHIALIIGKHSVWTVCSG